MRILILGSGGREHALGWRLSQDTDAHTLFFAPGNPGMAQLGQRLDIDLDDHQGLLLFAKKEAIDLTIVGPEQPLADGIVDAFTAEGLAIFGPNQRAAQLESSKAFAKALMAKGNIPTASYNHYSNPLDAMADLNHQPAPYVIKEDGLAAGKGVTIAWDAEEARTALENAAKKDMSVVVEGFLQGEELSVLAICDGTHAIPMVTAQDYKRIGNGQTGPNTGGMGSLAPVPWVDTAMMARIQTEVLDPMMATLRAEGIDYRGVLYAGLMIDDQKNIAVVEFNCRFGDPETQVVLPLLDEDLAPILMASAQGDCAKWAATGFAVKQGTTAISVVLASQGYPGAYQKHIPITLPNSLTNHQIIIHAGTKTLPSGALVTNGGRVLNAIGLGNTVDNAREHAYQLAKAIAFTGQTIRTDIGLPGANRAPMPEPHRQAAATV